MEAIFDFFQYRLSEHRHVVTFFYQKVVFWTNSSKFLKLWTLSCYVWNQLSQLLHFGQLLQNGVVPVPGAVHNHGATTKVKLLLHFVATPWKNCLETSTEMEQH